MGSSDTKYQFLATKSRHQRTTTPQCCSCRKANTSVAGGLLSMFATSNCFRSEARLQLEGTWKVVSVCVSVQCSTGCTTSNESLHHELNHWRETVPWLHWLCACHVRISICQTSLSYQGRHAQGYPGDEASSFPIREGFCPQPGLVQTASTASESSGSDQASRQG